MKKKRKKPSRPSNDNHDKVIVVSKDNEIDSIMDRIHHGEIIHATQLA